jgi:hypothetical protein
MLLTQRCPFLTKPVAHAFEIPALRKEREERGTHILGDASKIKKPRPPAPAKRSRDSLRSGIRGAVGFGAVVVAAVFIFMH